MATNNWIDANNDGDPSNTANWSLGALPVATNDVIIDRGFNPILGYDATTAWGVGLNSLTVTSGFQGGYIGGTNPLLFKMGSSKNIDIQASPNLAKVNIGAGSGNTWAKVRCNGVRDFQFVSGTLTDIEIDKGSGVIPSATSLINMRVGKAGKLWLGLLGGATSPTLIKVARGGMTVHDNETFL